VIKPIYCLEYNFKKIKLKERKKKQLKEEEDAEIKRLEV